MRILFTVSLNKEFPEICTLYIHISRSMRSTLYCIQTLY